MFTRYQSKLILFAYGREEKGFMSRDIKHIYHNILSFYRSMKSLILAGVFRKERSREINRNTFYLTEKGLNLAKALFELEDVPK